MDTIASCTFGEVRDDEEGVRDVRDAIRRTYPRIGDFNLYLYSTESDLSIDPTARAATPILGPATPIVEVLGPIPPYDLGGEDHLSFQPDEVVVLATVETARYTAYYVTSLMPESLLTQFHA